MVVMVTPKWHALIIRKLDPLFEPSEISGVRRVEDFMAAGDRPVLGYIVVAAGAFFVGFEHVHEGGCRGGVGVDEGGGGGDFDGGADGFGNALDEGVFGGGGVGDLWADCGGV